MLEGICAVPQSHTAVVSSSCAEESPSLSSGATLLISLPYKRYWAERCEGGIHDTHYQAAYCVLPQESRAVALNRTVELQQELQQPGSTDDSGLST